MTRPKTIGLTGNIGTGKSTVLKCLWRTYLPSAGRLLYRDGDKMPWAKRSTITGFVKDREYELIKDRDGRIDHILPFDTKGVATSQYVPQKGARVHEATFDLATLEPCGLGARGSRIGDKPTAKIAVAAPPA